MNKKEMSWPRRGDDPFRELKGMIGSPTWCSLDWLKGFRIDDSWYAEAFKNAGDKIIAELKGRRDRMHRDLYFIPVAYLYRHCLELKLKHLIHLCIDVGLVRDTKKAKEVLGDHGLHPLWNIAKAGLRKRWPNGPSDVLSGAEHVIQQFHSIDESGQNLRYSLDTSRKRTIDRLPSSVDLAHMRKVVDATYRLLNGCQMEFENEITFERNCGELLKSQGFSVEYTRQSWDLGVDIIATKQGLRYALQCKARESPSGVKAVQGAIAGKQHYQTDYAVVVSQGGVTRAASELATSVGVTLVVSSTLADVEIFVRASERR
jgi:hypothetical protein